MKSDFAMRKLTVCGTKSGGRCLESCKPQIDLDLNKEVKMSSKTRRLFAAVLVLCLLIQMQLAENGYAARRTKIAFTSSRDGNSEIYVMDGDGSNQRRVTVNPTDDGDPAWSPDGKKIAFVSNRNDVNKDHKRIWVIDADGKNPIRLTDGLVDVFPDWSPDGTKILYVTFDVPKDHNLAPGGITVMDADGKDKRLLKNRGGVFPSWSPDGKRIVYVDDGQIYVMDADGRNSEQLTHDVGFKRRPSWSHDGTRIAYVANHRIWVMDSNGKNERRLTKINSDEHPTWSPDSESIAFHSIVRDSVWGIYVVDVTNGAVDTLLSDPAFFNGDPDWLYPGGLSVSPEGSRITIWGRMKNTALSLR